MPEPEYGAVVVTGGAHKGRIGEYDDDDGNKGIVYFGHSLFATGHYLIPIRHLSSASTADLMRRHGELYDCIGLKARASGPQWRPDPEQHVELLTELAFVQHQIAECLFDAQFSTVRTGRRIFISHASKDKSFARLLAMDLASNGHRPWLDEWKIRAGESIPAEISKGLNDSDFVIVVLSDHAVESNWLEREWEAKYWDEVNSGKLHVIPALLRHCEIPTLLRAKKYADFTEDYNRGLEEILLSVKRPNRTRRKRSLVDAKR